MTEQTSIAPADAAAKLDSLIANPEFRTKLLASGAAETRQFHELMAAKSGSDKLDQVIAGTAEVPLVDLVTDGQLSTYNQMIAAADLRGIGVSDTAIRQVFEKKPVSRAEWDAVKGIKADRLADKEWRAKYMANDRVAVRDMALMNIVIVGGHT
ncbi:MAG: hypothetical protein WA850_00760 [Xanthobacteraceae bacterium]